MAKTEHEKASQKEHEVEFTEHEVHQEEHGSSKKKNAHRNKTITIGVIVIVLIIVGSFLGWLYTGQLSSAKEKVFKAIPLPAAIVDMQFVPAKTVIERLDLAKQLADAQGMGAQVKPSDTYDQLIESKKIQALAAKYKLSVPKADIDEEYQNIIKQYANGDENAFKTELQTTYGMTPDKFKSEVVQQELLQSQLLIWYNKQQDLNKDSYAKLKDLQSKLDSGQSFDDVSKAYTADAATKDFAGDSGVIPFSSLLPEFRVALKDAKTGDVKTVVSRYGLHILKVLDINNSGDGGAEQIHLQQIFVKQTGFTDWLAKAEDNIRVIKLLKF